MSVIKLTNIIWSQFRAFMTYMPLKIMIVERLFLYYAKRLSIRRWQCTLQFNSTKKASLPIDVEKENLNKISITHDQENLGLVELVSRLHRLAKHSGYIQGHMTRRRHQICSHLMSYFKQKTNSNGGDARNCSFDLFLFHSSLALSIIEGEKKPIVRLFHGLQKKLCTNG